MIKRKNKNKLTVNLYSGGGPFNIAPAIPDYNAARAEMQSLITPNTTPSSSNPALSQLKEGALGMASGIVSSSSLLGAPQEKEITPELNTKSTANSNAGLLAEYDSWERLENKNWRDFTDASGMDVLNSAIGGAAGGASGGPMGMAIGAGMGALQSGISTLTKRKKAQQQASEYNKELARLNRERDNNFINKVNKINDQTAINMKSNLFAEGGNLNVFNTGGTHEQNPLGGIPLGIGSNGLPNKVEEGEVSYNNYIYSNRIAIDKRTAKMLNLPDKYVGATYAKVAEDLSSQNKERPNDVITNRMVDKELGKLREAQEMYKMKQKAKQQIPSIPEDTNMFWEGGDLNLNGFFDYDNPYSLSNYNNLNKPSYGLREFKNQELPVEMTPFNTPNYGTDILKADSIAIPETPKTPSKLQMPDDWDTYLRYAPVLGNAGGVIGDMFGMNKPDYSGADNIIDATSKMAKMNYTPIADYMTYAPMDTNYLFTRAANNNASTQRAIRESAEGNRGAAQLALLTSDQNYNNSLAEIGRQADDYNYQKRLGTAEFNRGTNLYNKQQEIAANTFNLGIDQAYLNAVAQAEQLKAAERNQRNLNRQANINGLLDTLSGIGQEAFARNMIDSNPALAYQMGLLGNIKYKNSNK